MCLSRRRTWTAADAIEPERAGCPAAQQPCHLGVEENQSPHKEGAACERDQDGCVARPDAAWVVSTEAQRGHSSLLWRLASMGERYHGAGRSVQRRQHEAGPRVSGWQSPEWTRQ